MSLAAVLRLGALHDRRAAGCSVGPEGGRAAEATPEVPLWIERWCAFVPAEPLCAYLALSAAFDPTTSVQAWFVFAAAAATIPLEVAALQLAVRGSGDASHSPPTLRTTVVIATITAVAFVLWSTAVPWHPIAAQHSLARAAAAGAGVLTTPLLYAAAARLDAVPAAAGAAGARPGSSSSPAAYVAFISYAHGDRSHALALERRLRRYRIPRSLRGTRTRGGEPLPDRLPPGSVFLDEFSHRPSRDLRMSLRNAIDASRHMVVLCSPRSAGSRWVDWEVLYFGKLDRATRLWPVVVGGDPNDPRTCFPRSLRDPVPAAVDRRRIGRRRAADLCVLAELLDVDREVLADRDAREVRRSLGAWACGAIALAVGVLYLLDARRSAERDREVTDAAASLASDVLSRGPAAVAADTRPLWRLARAADDVRLRFLARCLDVPADRVRFDALRAECVQAVVGSDGSLRARALDEVLVPRLDDPATDPAEVATILAVGSDLSAGDAASAGHAFPAIVARLGRPGVDALVSVGRLSIAADRAGAAELARLAAEVIAAADDDTERGRLGDWGRAQARALDADAAEAWSRALLDAALRPASGLPGQALLLALAGERIDALDDDGVRRLVEAWDDLLARLPGEAETHIVDATRAIAAGAARNVAGLPAGLPDRLRTLRNAASRTEADELDRAIAAVEGVRAPPASRTVAGSPSEPSAPHGPPAGAAPAPPAVGALLAAADIRALATGIVAASGRSSLGGEDRRRLIGRIFALHPAYVDDASLAAAFDGLRPLAGATTPEERSVVASWLRIALDTPGPAPREDPRSSRRVALVDGLPFAVPDADAVALVRWAIRNLEEVLADERTTSPRRLGRDIRPAVGLVEALFRRCEDTACTDLLGVVLDASRNPAVAGRLRDACMGIVERIPEPRLADALDVELGFVSHASDEVLEAGSGALVTEMGIWLCPRLRSAATEARLDAVRRTARALRDARRPRDQRIVATWLAAVCQACPAEASADVLSPALGALTDPAAIRILATAPADGDPRSPQATMATLRERLTAAVAAERFAESDVDALVGAAAAAAALIAQADHPTRIRAGSAVVARLLAADPERAARLRDLAAAVRVLGASVPAARREAAVDHVASLLADDDLPEGSVAAHLCALRELSTGLGPDDARVAFGRAARALAAPPAAAAAPASAAGAREEIALGAVELAASASRDVAARAALQVLDAMRPVRRLDDLDRLARVVAALAARGGGSEAVDGAVWEHCLRPDLVGAWRGRLVPALRSVSAAATTAWLAPGTRGGVRSERWWSDFDP